MKRGQYLRLSQPLDYEALHQAFGAEDWTWHYGVERAIPSADQIKVLIEDLIKYAGTPGAIPGQEPIITNYACSGGIEVTIVHGEPMIAIHTSLYRHLKGTAV